MQIPKIIHFIWAGGTKILPEKNLRTILQWADNNPGFKIQLWVDSASTSALEQRYQRVYESIKEGQALSDVVTFVDINTLEDSPVYNIVRYEIDRLFPNYGVSSDLLRYAILYAQGGAYFDSDVTPSKLLSLQESGIFTEDTLQHRLFVDTNSQQTGHVGNDALVCTRNNPLIKSIGDLALYNCLPNHEIDKKLLQLGNQQFERDLSCDAYYMDVPLSRKEDTPLRTGPAVVRNIVNEKSDDPFITIFRENSDSDIGDITNYIDKESATTNHGNWLANTITVDAENESPTTEAIVDRISQTILFEIENFKILRLPEHVKQGYLALKKHNITDKTPDEILGMLITKLNDNQNFHNKINDLKVMQWHYRFDSLLTRFADHHHLNHFEISALFPHTKEDCSIRPNVLLERATENHNYDIIEPENGGVASIDQAGMQKEYGLQYLEDAVRYVQNLPEYDERERVSTYFQGIKATLSGHESDLIASERDEQYLSVLETYEQRLKEAVGVREEDSCASCCRIS